MRRLPALGLAVLASLALVACGGSSDSAAPPLERTTTIDMGTGDAARERAPAVAGQSLGGDVLALGDFRGRPVLLNVWSSW